MDVLPLNENAGIFTKKTLRTYLRIHVHRIRPPAGMATGIARVHPAFCVPKWVVEDGMEMGVRLQLSWDLLVRHNGAVADTNKTRQQG
jgi:hypothetical protein